MIASTYMAYDCIAHLLLAAQSHFPLGDAQGLEQGLLRVGAQPRQSVLLPERHQVRPGELPRALSPPLQVRHNLYGLESYHELFRRLCRCVTICTAWRATTSSSAASAGASQSVRPGELPRVLSPATCSNGETCMYMHILSFFILFQFRGNSSSNHSRLVQERRLFAWRKTSQ